MGRMILGLILMLSVVTLSSCRRSDENLTDPSPPTYKNLEERDHVLFNLGFSYNGRNLERFIELLDDDFVFHFSPADYRAGQVRVERWNRAALAGSTSPRAGQPAAGSGRDRRRPAARPGAEVPSRAANHRRPCSSTR